MAPVHDDAVAFEAEKEREALLKSIHKPMKTWYTKEGTESEILNRKEKFGKFPLFWQELKEWKHQKEVYDLYQLASNPQPPPVAVTADKPKECGGEADSSSTAPTTGSTRKRKSRWAKATSAAAAPDAKTAPSTRWSEVAPGNTLQEVKVLPSGFTVPVGLDERDEDVFVYKLKLEHLKIRMARIPEDAARREVDPDRSPSPEPIYTVDGTRKNSRQQRMLDACKRTEESLMIGMLRRDPSLKAHYDFKITRKVYMPIKDYPDYNFIGLVLGPRGATQRSMEEETGCKIAIRGKGSVREGRNVRLNSQAEQMMNDDLHVLITGEDPEMVEQAVNLVTPLLTPLDDDRNVHKQRQLRQLALINGTLREVSYCNYCGEEGHQNFACPNRQKAEAGRTTVKCSICGEVSHVTSDCKYTTEELANKKQKVDGDFQNFMADLGNAPPAARHAAPPPVSTYSQRQAPPVAQTSAVSGRGVSNKPAWMLQKEEAAAVQTTPAVQQAVQEPPPEQVAQGLAPSMTVSAPPPNAYAPPPHGAYAPPPNFGGVPPPLLAPAPGPGGFAYAPPPGMAYGYPPPPPMSQFNAPPPNMAGFYAPPPMHAALPSAGMQHHGGQPNIDDWSE